MTPSSEREGLLSRSKISSQQSSRSTDATCKDTWAGAVENQSEQLQKMRDADVRAPWSAFLRFLRMYRDVAPNCKRDVIVLLVLGIARSGFTIGFSYVFSFFMTALQKKDEGQFWTCIFGFVIILSLGVPIVVYYSYCKDMAIFRWRKWLTNHILSQFFKDKNYYHIEVNDKVDNTDQRIAEDVKSFTTISIELFMSVFFATIDFLGYSSILLRNYPSLFPALLAYAVGGTFVTILLGRHLVTLNFVQTQKEADFRFSLGRVRNNAESVAFYACYEEDRERCEVQQYFDVLLENWQNLIRRTKNVALWTTAYSYGPQILPYAGMASLYFAGEVEFGVLMLSAQAYQHVLNDLSLIVSQFRRTSALCACVSRLGDLENLLGASCAKIAQQTSSLPCECGSELMLSEQNQWSGQKARSERVSSKMRTILLKEVAKPLTVMLLESVSVLTPTKPHRLILRSVSARLKRGESLLIMGPSGCGKSSLLRAIAGLWSNGSGHISRPHSKDMLFLPQKPYCTLGTLREQLIYPRAPAGEHEISKKQLAFALQAVNLAFLPERVGGLDSKRDWSGILSLGEQQRLVFARALVNAPLLCILDEATSGVDVDTEDRLYSALRRAVPSYISVGHRPSLLKHHNFILKLHVGGREHNFANANEANVFE